MGSYDTYVYCPDATTVWVMQPIRTKRAVGPWRLWQCAVFKKNPHTLRNTCVVYSGAHDVWMYGGLFLTGLMSKAAADVVVYGNSDWTRNGTWTTRATPSGAVDDQETAGVSSVPMHSTATQGDYAELAITVPAGWSGASLDMTWYDREGNVANYTGGAQFTLKDADGVLVPLNGRGSVQRPASSHGLPYLAGVRLWDKAGTNDQRATEGYSNTNYTLELARDLKPGTYTLRVTRVVAGATNPTYTCGRVRIHNPNQAPTPAGLASGGTVTLWCPEFAAKANAASNPTVTDPGPYQQFWGGAIAVAIQPTASGDYQTAIFSGDQGHGFIKAAAAIEFKGDGAAITPASGAVFGPYSAVTVKITNTNLDTRLKAHGQACTRSTDTITFVKGTDAADYTALTNVAETDLVAIEDMTSTNGEHLRFYTIKSGGINVGAKTIQLNTGPNGWASSTRAVGVSDFTDLATCVHNWTFAGGSATCKLDVTWLQAVQINRMYVAQLAPTSTATSSFTPQHPSGTYPYAASHVNEVARYDATKGNTGLMPLTTTSVTGQKSKTWAYHFRNMEGFERADTGRILVVELDPALMVGGDYTTGGAGSFILASESKLYQTMADKETPEVGEAWSTTMVYYFADAAYLDAQPSTHGTTIRVGL